MNNEFYVNNVNIGKIKELAKSKGIKIKFICSQLGLSETYLSNVKNGKDRMTEERLFKIAEILGTSFEYLTDMTDDPEPDFIIRTAGTLQDRLQNEIVARYNTMTEDQRELLDLIINMDSNEAKKALAVLRAIKGE